MRGTWSLAGILVAVAWAGCFSTSDGAAPTAQFTATVGDDGRSVKFDASASTGQIAEYHWRFGDGTQGQGVVVAKTYDVTDTTVYASLLVAGPGGGANISFEEVSLGSGGNGAPVIDAAEGNRWVMPEGSVTIDASPSHDPDNDSLGATWYFGRFPLDDPPEARFTTGVLGPGNESSGRFDIEGAYLIRDAEHPWMRMWLVVEDGGDAPQNLTVDLRNFGFGDGGIGRLASGGTVRFVNQDPVEHRALVAYFGAGTEQGSDLAFTTPSLSAGTYQATLVLEDGKGGLAVRSWGVRASTDAPTLDDRTYEEGNVVQQGEDFHYAFPGDVLFDAIVFANLSWEALAAPEPSVDLAVVLRGTETPAGPAAECSATACTLAGRLNAGVYEWEVIFESGVFQSARLVTSYVVFGDPGVANAELGPSAHGHWTP